MHEVNWARGPLGDGPPSAEPLANRLGRGRGVGEKRRGRKRDRTGRIGWRRRPATGWLSVWIAGCPDDEARRPGLALARLGGRRTPGCLGVVAVFPANRRAGGDSE